MLKHGTMAIKHPDSPKMHPYLASHYVDHQSLDSEIQKRVGARDQPSATSDPYRWSPQRSLAVLYVALPLMK